MAQATLQVVQQAVLHRLPNFPVATMPAYLINKSGFVLAVCQNSGERGTELIQYTKMGEKGQKWKLDGNKLQCDLGLFAAVSENSRERGAGVVTWHSTDERGQQ